MMAGPVGTIATALAGINAVKTLIDPSSSKFDIGAALLITGSTALAKAAGMMLKASGKEDPKAEAAASKQQEKLLETQIAAQEKKVAKLKPNDPTRMKEENDLLYMKQELETARKESKDLQDRVNSMATTAARKEAEDKAALAEKEGKSGLFPPVEPQKTRTAEEIADQQKQAETDLVKSNTDLANKTAAYAKAFEQSQAKPGKKTAETAAKAEAEMNQERAKNQFIIDGLKKLQEERERKPTASVEPPPGEQPQQMAALDQSAFNNVFNTAISGTKVQVEEPPMMQVDTSNLPMIKIDTSNLPTSIPVSVTGGGGKPVDKGSVAGTG
jgi:hypothetical protein